MGSYHLIERRPDGATREIVLGSRTYPVPAIVEDDDGMRLLLTADMHLTASVWHWALGAGVVALVNATNSTYALAATFGDERTENERMQSYVLAEAYWRPYRYGMSYTEMAGVRPVEPEPERPTEPLRFVHLHTHGEHSALDGLSTMKEIIAAVKADGQTAVALTDHGNCAVHPILALEAAKAGIQPIFGMEAYFVDDRFARGPEHRYSYQHLVLWAMNDIGLANLWAISTEGYRDGDYDKKPRIDWDTLERHAEGVLASTACLRGPLAYPYLNGDEERALHNLSRLKTIFSDRLYIEIHANQLAEQKRVNEWLVGVSETYEVPLLAVVDSHYAAAEDKHDHRVWLSVQTDADVADDTSLFGGNQDYHLMTEAEVRAALAYLGQDVVDVSVENTALLAQRCTAQLTGKNHNPVFSRPTKEWPDPVAHDVDRLFTMCMDLWDERTKGKTHDQQVYLDRFEREIGMIIRKGYPGYFLMVADFVNWAKDNGILVGPGRGSGGGSLVAYVTKITELDPVENELLFERFMTEGRTALPDFDIDFPTSKKVVMLNYIAERWGADHIATVGTHMRLKSKGIVNDVSRAIKSELPEDYYVDTRAVSAIIGEAEAGTAGIGLSWEDLWAEHGEVLDPYRDKYPQLFGYCDKLHGRLKSYGTHPAGVIIDPDNPLSGALPLRSGKNGMVTQWDMDALEALGFTKFDMLNLLTLDTLQGTVDSIKETTGRWVDIYSWRDEYLDPQIFGEVSDGWTLGIFQIETQSGTQMVRRFKPETLAELADVITLVRPGPVRSGLTETYFRRRSGDEETWVPDPRLEPVLAKTLGCMLYQEDIMQTTMVLAGYESDEADTVRRILGKKKIEAVLAEGEKFIRRCIDNGVEAQVAEDLWEQMAEFAKYSFNRAHAFAYATLGFWTAWLKFHYPIQFINAALTTMSAEKPERVPEFVEEARRLGYAVQPPDINESGIGFTVGKMAVRYGLLAIKGVGEAACASIIGPRTEGGPYTSFEDFLERKGPGCNAGTVKKLARIGAFDSLVPNRRGLEARIEAEAWAASGTDSCQFKVDDERTVTWIEKIGMEPTVEQRTLPCAYDWPAEPDKLGRTGKPEKRKAPVKKCTRGCRRFTPVELADVDDHEPYTEEEIRNIEMDMLGIYLSSTPFDRIPAELREGLATAIDVLSSDPGVYPMAAIVKGLRPRPGGDKYGNAMGWATLTTERGELEVTIFSKPFSRYRQHLNVTGDLILVAVEKDTRGHKLIELEPIN